MPVAFVTDQQDTVGQWAAKRMGCGWAPEISTAIGLVWWAEDASPAEARLIVGVIFSSFNGRSMEIQGAVETEHSDKLTKGFLAFCARYAFQQAKVHKLRAHVAEGNVASQRFVARLGFQLEATLQDSHPTGALLVYGLTADRCRWLSMNVPEGYDYGRRLRSSRTRLRCVDEAAG